MTTEHGAAERRAEMRAIERAEALPYTTIPPSRPWEPFLFAGFVTLVILGVILSLYRVYDKRWYADAVRDLEARLA